MPRVSHLHAIGDHAGLQRLLTTASADDPARIVVPCSCRRSSCFARPLSSTSSDAATQTASSAMRSPGCRASASKAAGGYAGARFSSPTRWQGLATLGLGVGVTLSNVALNFALRAAVRHRGRRGQEAPAPPLPQRRGCSARRAFSGSASRLAALPMLPDLAAPMLGLIQTSQWEVSAIEQPVPKLLHLGSRASSCNRRREPRVHGWRRPVNRVDTSDRPAQRSTGGTRESARGRLPARFGADAARASWTARLRGCVAALSTRKSATKEIVDLEEAERVAVRASDVPGGSPRTGSREHAPGRERRRTAARSRRTLRSAGRRAPSTSTRSVWKVEPSSPPAFRRQRLLERRQRLGSRRAEEVVERIHHVDGVSQHDDRARVGVERLDLCRGSLREEVGRRGLADAKLVPRSYAEFSRYFALAAAVGRPTWCRSLPEWWSILLCGRSEDLWMLAQEVEDRTSVPQRARAHDEEVRSTRDRVFPAWFRGCGHIEFLVLRGL